MQDNYKTLREALITYKNTKRIRNIAIKESPRFSVEFMEGIGFKWDNGYYIISKSKVDDAIEKLDYLINVPIAL